MTIGHITKFLIMIGQNQVYRQINPIVLIECIAELHQPLRIMTYLSNFYVLLALMCWVCSKLRQGIYYEIGYEQQSKIETLSYISSQTGIWTLDLWDGYPVP